MDIKKLRDAIRAFDSSKGSDGAYICGLWYSSKQRLCEYVMQAIVTKMSTDKDSAVKAIAKIDMSVEDFLTAAVCFKSRIEREIGLVSDVDHGKCTPFKSKLPSLRMLKAKTLGVWEEMNAEAFERQARVSGLEDGGSDDDEEEQDAAGPCTAARKRSRDEYEAAKSE